MAWDCLLLKRSLAPERVAGEVFWGLHWWKRGSLGFSCVPSVNHFIFFLWGPLWRMMELQWTECFCGVNQQKPRVEGQETPRGKCASPGFWELSGSLRRCVLEMDSAFSCARSLAASQHRTGPAGRKSLCPYPPPSLFLVKREPRGIHGVGT